MTENKPCVMEDLTCPSCSKTTRIDTANDSKVRCPSCKTFLKVVVMLDGEKTLAKIPSKASDQLAKLYEDTTKEAKVNDDPTWRSFVVQRNRVCGGCDKPIKKYQCAYGLIENQKVTKIICMKCNAKTLLPDEENPIYKMAPKIVQRPKP